MLVVTNDGRVVETNDEEELELQGYDDVKEIPLPEPEPDVRGDLIPEPEPDIKGDPAFADERTIEEIVQDYSNLQVQDQMPPEEPKKEETVTVTTNSEKLGGIRVFPEGKETGLRLINVGPIDDNGMVDIRPKKTEYGITRYPGETDNLNGDNLNKVRFITIIVTQERYDEIYKEVRNSTEETISFDTKKGRVAEESISKAKLEEYKNKLQSIIDRSQFIDNMSPTDIEKDIQGYINSVEPDSIDNKDGSSIKM